MPRPSPREPTSTLRISGMTCPSCELLLERRLKAVPGVRTADVSHRTGVATVTGTAATTRLAAAVRSAGYSLTGEAASTPPADSPRRKWLEIGASLLLIFALGKLLESFNLLSLAPSTSGALSVGGIFLIGLIAGTSSCLAVTGGLLLALAARHNEIHQAETPAERFRPLLQFNVGRLVSYFALGGLTGVVGQSITLSTRMTGYMNVVVALVMLYLALHILGIIPKGRFPIRPPKKLSRWIMGLSDSHHPAAPFALGALTFFLPCGFTQSLQLAALASGSFATGATVMFVFALGTLPALLGISALSSAASGQFSRLFLRFSGALVLVLGLFNLNSGLALTGITMPSAGTTAIQPAPAVIGDVQEVSVKVTSYGTYEPSNVTIKAGIPVRWTVDGTEAFGCTSVMTIPALNVSKPLHAGKNVIEFTAPAKPGSLAFMCSMGMVRGSFTVI